MLSTERVQAEMNPYFQSLGDRIEQRWRATNYDEEIFPELVLAEMEKDPPTGRIEVEDIIKWLSGPAHGFVQPSSRTLFGEPPVTLFEAPRFFIEALFWFSGTTAIHEHGFSGVFAVLAGASVHSQWRFVREHAINSRLLSGRLERMSTEILLPGGMRLIRSGERLIHQLFHLETPSVTIVIRTYVDRNHLPQYQYLPPGLAIDPEDHDPLRTRRIMLLDRMARGQMDGLRSYAQRLIDNGDAETMYHTFSTLSRRKMEKELLAELYERAHDRYGDIIGLIRRVCAEERRTRIITVLRTKVSNSEIRFLLALLMLMPDRDAILTAIQLQAHNVEPLVAIESWLDGMSGSETLGFDYSDVNKLIFHGLVQGWEVEGIIKRLRSEFQDHSVDTNRDRLVAHMKQMANSDLFYPLFSNSPLREDAVHIGSGA
jgi:hypothetical protein